MKQRYQMWAISGEIVGKRFLYVGSWFTRQEAIRDHCRAYLGGTCDGNDLVRCWRRRRAKGDRAIKVVVEWDDE